MITTPLATMSSSFSSVRGFNLMNQRLTAVYTTSTNDFDLEGIIVCLATRILSSLGDCFTVYMSFAANARTDLSLPRFVALV